MGNLGGTAPRRLPPGPAGGWLFREPLVRLWLRPWFDGAALHGIAHWYFPLSRAWAAALVADGDPARFWRELPGSGRRPAGLGRPLAMVGQRWRTYEQTFRSWQARLFGAEAGDDGDRLALERARQRAASRLVLSRLAFLPWAVRRALPAVKWRLSGPDAVVLEHGQRLASDAAAYPPPTVPTVARSHPVAGPRGPECWLRFAAPVPGTGGDAWAHVYDPPGLGDPPTMIFLHGTSVEPVFWPYRGDPIAALAGRGVRVIRPEAPWHGHRRLPGSYAGEPMLARAPLGLLELFAAWAAEIAVLVAWARRTSRGPVALGGVSLGALVAQRIATAARHWPDEMRPDALLLVSTSGDLGAIFESGDLSRALGLSARLRAHGWTAEVLAEWLPLVQPTGEPAISPDRIVIALGDVDRVTPFAGGRALVERWRVPAGNLFIRHGGHFSAAVGIGADDAPLRRLLELL